MAMNVDCKRLNEGLMDLVRVLTIEVRTREVACTALTGALSQT